MQFGSGSLDIETLEVPSETPFIPLVDEKPSDAKEVFINLLNHIRTKYPRTKCNRYFKNILFFSASAGCMWLYIEPNLEYSREHKKDLGETILIFIGNTIPAAFVLLNASPVYPNLLAKRKDIKQALNNYLDPSKIALDNRDSYIIWGGAILSASLLAATVFSTSSELPLGVQILKAGIVLGANSLNYTLAMHLSLSIPVTRKLLFSPVLFFYYPLYEWPRQCRMNVSDQWNEALVQQIKEDHDALKKLFTDAYEKATKLILDDAFTLQLSWNPKECLYNLNFSKITRSALNTPDSFERHLTLVQNGISLLPPPKPDKEVTGLMSKCWNYGLKPILNTADWVIGKIMWLGGATVMSTGLAGFVMSVVNEAYAVTQSEEAAWSIASVPTFVMVVFTAHFGGLLVKGIYDYLIACVKKENEIPLAIKLYPKTVLSLLALAAFISPYSPQTAMLLIQKNFADKKYDAIREILIGCANYGISGFTFINLFQIILTSAQLFAEKYGSDDEKSAVDLVTQGNNLILAVSNIDGQIFEDNLREMSPEHRRIILGDANDEKFKQLIDHEDNLQRKLIENSQKVRGCRSCFLPPPKQSNFSINSSAKLLPNRALVLSV